MFIDLRENTDQLPLIHAPTGDQTCNLGVCPDWRSKTQSSGVRDDAPASRATWPELDSIDLGA